MYQSASVERGRMPHTRLLGELGVVVREVPMRAPGVKSLGVKSLMCVRWEPG